MGVPIISIVGVSDSGKTTLLEKLIPKLVERGLRVGTIKHDVHGFQMDHEGKDSWRHKQAGACTTVISSPRKVAMVKEVDSELTLDQIAERFLDDVDVILTEGYKRQDKPKIEVHRKSLGHPLLCGVENGLIAVVSDEPLSVEVPCFHLDDVEGLSRFLLDYLGLEKRKN